MDVLCLFFLLFGQNLLNFSLKKNTNSASDEEIERFCHEVVQHSLQTTNINFHNQLFGCVDFYGLAASWITEVGLN